MRNVFYSFHYKPDSHRAALVRNIGALTGNKPASDNDWEKITKGGDAAIKKWVDDQMAGRSCAVVLVGAQTAARKWINYEIEKAWNDGRGVLGVHVHNLKDLHGNQAAIGKDPFDYLTVGNKTMSSIVECHNPPFATSTNVYNHIAANIETWIEDAIKIRKNH